MTNSEFRTLSEEYYRGFARQVIVQLEALTGGIITVEAVAFREAVDRTEKNMQEMVGGNIKSPNCLKRGGHWMGWQAYLKPYRLVTLKELSDFLVADADEESQQAVEQVLRKKPFGPCHMAETDLYYFQKYINEIIAFFTGAGLAENIQSTKETEKYLIEPSLEQFHELLVSLRYNSLRPEQCPLILNAFRRPVPNMATSPPKGLLANIKSILSESNTAVDPSGRGKKRK